MPPYEFEGPEKFAEKAASGARKPHLAGEIAGHPDVRGVADAIRRLQEAEGEPARHEAHQGLLESMDKLSLVQQTAQAMAREALPPLGFAQPSTLEQRKFAAAPLAPPEDPDDPYAHEQPTDAEGNPLTLDPNNPEHAEYIRKAPKYGSTPSVLLGIKQSGRWQDVSSRLAARALQGDALHAGDLIRESPRQATQNAPGGLPIDAAAIDRQWDAYVRSQQGQRELKESARQQRLRATGTDVSPSGMGMTSKPNTGINQDINMGMTPASEQPPQSVDPFQGHRPGHVEPPAQREAQAPVTPAGQQPMDTPAQQAAAASEGGKKGTRKGE